MDIQPNLKKLEYLFCLHLQATCQQNKQVKPCQQVIQLSIVLVSFKESKPQILDKFHEFVKPRFNTKLSEYCREVTGLKDQPIKSDRYVQVVLELLAKWIAKFQFVDESNSAFLTWGSWNLKKCLMAQLKIKKIQTPNFIHSFIDIKRVYNYKVQQANYGVFQALKKMGIDINTQQNKNSTKSQKLALGISYIAIRLFQQGKFKPNRKFVTVLNQKPNVNVTQDLQYLLVLDFQATCQQNVKLKPCSEIIEFPVMVIYLKQRKIIKQFHYYITPTFNPQLTKFCTSLTGITQQMVTNKPKLQQVLKQIDNWINSQEYLHSKNFTFVTCGDWDLSNCLKNEAKVKNIELPDYLKNYINIKKVFEQFVPNYNRSQGMMGMLAALKIQHEGRHHSGIDDVKNICNVCIGLMDLKGVKYTKKFITYVK